MIVTCPNCETKFEIPDDKYRPGRKARCSNCGFVFPLPDIDEPVASPEADARDAVRAVEDDIDAIFAESGADGRAGALSGDDSASGEATSQDQAADPPPENAAPIPAPPASFDDVVSPSAETRAPQRSGKKFLLILVVLFALALLTYGGIMVYSALFAPVTSSDPVRASDSDVVSSLGGQSGGADAAKEAARQAAVSRLSLENVRQQTVTENEQTGPMVVIEGTVVNNFDTPRDLILLEVTLYDSKGNALVMREQYCRVTLSLMQLRTLSKAALESALSNQVDILTNNADIPPGGRVPFTTVFFDLPNTAYEFEVKIVDVQDPSQKK